MLRAGTNGWPTVAATPPPLPHPPADYLGSPVFQESWGRNRMDGQRGAEVNSTLSRLSIGSGFFTSLLIYVLGIFSFGKW
jgi:hypothetical protein